MRPLADRLPLSQILYTMSVLQETQNRMSRTANRRTELEMSIVRICNPAMDSSIDAVLTRLEALEAAVRKGSSLPQLSMTAAEEEKKQTEPVRRKKAPSSIQEQADIPSFSDAKPFGQWQEVLGRLLKTNPPLFAALKASDAYEKGDLMLIDAKNELFFKLIRENEFAKDSLRDALLAQTGKRYRLGPYRMKEPSQTPKDPLDVLLESAKGLGIPVEEK